MAEMLLTDIPAAGFQAILHFLKSADFASLRAVNRFISDLTTKHTPHMTLWLTSVTSTDQLQQWHKATQQLQHVPSVHIIVTGTVAADAFQLAMQLLSQRTGITELRFHSSESSSSFNICEPFRRAQILTLQPLIPLLHRLKSLQLNEEIAVTDLAGNLQKLAAAAPVGGWKLQRLTLLASWTPIDEAGLQKIPSWLDVCSGLGHLATAFPLLQELSISLSDLAVGDEHEWLEQRDHCILDWLAHITVVAALGNAVVQLKFLEALWLTSLPEIWIQRKALGKAADCMQSSPAAAAETEAADALLASGLLPSVTAAAATFATMENFGCWLLQHIPSLTQLQMKPADFWEWPSTGVVMSWQSEQQHVATSVPSSDSATRCRQAATAAAGASQEKTADSAALSCMRLVQAQYNSTYKLPYGTQEATNTTTISTASSSSITSSSILPYSLKLHDQLSPYSSRPASELLTHISSCKIKMQLCDIDGLDDLLSDLRSLKHLEVTLEREKETELPSDSISSHTAGAAAVIAAAAAQVKGLQFFSLSNHSQVKIVLPCDALLPLTAVARGPGSSLQRLCLIGHLTASTEVAAAVVTAAVNRPSVEAASRVSSRADVADAHLVPAVGHLTDELSAVDIASNSSAATAPASCVCSSHQADSTPRLVAEGSNTTATAAAAAGACCVTTSQPHQQHSSATGEHIACGTAAAAAASPDNRFLPTLWQLDGLRELELCQYGEGRLALAVEWLPASLEVLKCCRLNVVTAAEITSAGSSEGSLSPSVLAEGSYHTLACCRPQLMCLELHRSYLSSPSSLASRRLRRLTVQESTWSGGWSRAASAWPAVEVLEWHLLYPPERRWAADADFGDDDEFWNAQYVACCVLPEIMQYEGRNISSDDMQQWSRVVDARLVRVGNLELCMALVMKDLLSAGFSNLKVLVVQDIHFLSVNILQLAVQQFREHNLNLKCLTLCMSACFSALQGKLVTLASIAAAADTNSSRCSSNNTSSSNRVTCYQRALDLPAMQRWLQQQFPWASVDVVDWMGPPYQG